MDEIEVLRAARPQVSYPAGTREATRARLLAAAAEPVPQARHADPRRRVQWPRAWQVGFVGALAIGGIVAVTATPPSPGGTRTQHIADGVHPPGTSAAQVLLLAAKAASGNTPPPGARWIVRETQMSSTAWPAPQCRGLVTTVAAPAYAKLPGASVFASCLPQAPSAIPQLRNARTITVPVNGAGYPAPSGLPGEPRPLLNAIYRWYTADYAKNADSLPGQPAPPLSTAGLQAGAFDVLRQMLTAGVTSPSPAVQLQALALIPGTSVVTNARNAAGRPGIAVTITADNPAEVGFSKNTIIFDARTFQDIGVVLVHPSADGSGGTVTISTAQLWQAYYDASGRRL